MVIRPSDLKEQFEKLRKGEARKRTLSTGFDCLDEYMKFAKGYMAIITGYPGCGKSEWLDAVLVNMTIMHQWKVMYYSPENHPIEQHMGKLAEKYIGENILQFNPTQMTNSIEYLDSHFRFINPEIPDLDTILLRAKILLETEGLDCLVIDPWNAVTHSRGGEMIHEYLSAALSKIIKFARDKNVLVAIVAHPTKPQKDKDGNIPVPTLYDISDGAMWRNKADYGIVCHRPDMSKNQMQVYINKVKFKFMGGLGMVELDYCYRTGRFKCLNEKEFLLPNEVQCPF